MNEEKIRCSTVERNTKETKIKISLNLDGEGRYEIDTGVKFFDHMLSGFARHGLFDLTVKVDGDIEVDDHHTIEDTGIVLGTAIRQALGDKSGIRRYGSSIDMSTQMVREFFYAISYSAAMNLHMKILDGVNDHHKAEALFKSFARALSEAAAKDPEIHGVLSTKGSI